ncbi:MAG TPA: protein TolQ [candidate division Zixibacteria bacterium]|nr:protein TolQ [candidate division Zixibacteria bacterium]
MSFLWPLQLLAQNGIQGVQQHGILDLVRGSGPVVQFVLYLLVLFSVVSWGIIFYKYRQVKQAKRESDQFIDIFWERRNLSSIHEASRELKASPVAQVFRAGYEELVRVSRTKKEATTGEPLTTELSGVDNVARAMKRATSVEITKLEKSLNFLATTASAAPFIGLFGTVWGIMNAFRGLSVTHSSSIQAVAPGIAEALIATAVGLAAAIPALMAYNHFVQRIKVLAVEMDNFSHEFLNIAERHFFK